MDLPFRSYTHRGMGNPLIFAEKVTLLQLFYLKDGILPIKTVVLLIIIVDVPFIQETLVKHNNLRAQHQNTGNLKWDDSLAKVKFFYHNYLKHLFDGHLFLGIPFMIYLNNRVVLISLLDSV